MLSTLSPGPNVFSRPRTTCSYATKSMPQHVLQLCCWTWKKIEKLYFVIQGKNANKFLVSLVSSSQETTGNAMVSDHSASSFISMLFTFSWAHYMKHADITEIPKLTKPQDTSAAWSFWVTGLINHLQFPASSNKIVRNSSW